MSELLAFTAYLLLPLIGIGIWRLEAVRRLDFGGRIAVGGAAGIAIVTSVLAMLSIVSISWSRSIVITIVFVITAITVIGKRDPLIRLRHLLPRARGRRALEDSAASTSVGRLPMLALAILAVLFVYGLL